MFRNSVFPNSTLMMSLKLKWVLVATGNGLKPGTDPLLLGDLYLGEALPQ